MSSCRAAQPGQPADGRTFSALGGRGSAARTRLADFLIFGGFGHDRKLEEGRGGGGGGWG